MRRGLSQPQKILPSKYLYDAVGTALFQAITELAEYGLTRADDRVLARCAPQLVKRLGRVAGIIELGSGTGLKTRPILQAFCKGQRALDYYAIDGSRAALENCRKELSDIKGLRVRGFEAGYLEGLSRVPRKGNGHRPFLVLFLGGSIGNFHFGEAVGFLSDLRHLLRPGDFLLLGVDLEKEVATLLRAYDDTAGVTAAFNLNVLARINRELGANFDLGRFRHEARWSVGERRIEMHLRSTARQAVSIPGARYVARFVDGETIWTESSQRFTVKRLEEIATRSGFHPWDVWVDKEWPFAESLWAIPITSRGTLGPEARSGRPGPRAKRHPRGTSSVLQLGQRWSASSA